MGNIHRFIGHCLIPLIPGYFTVWNKGCKIKVLGMKGNCRDLKRQDKDDELMIISNSNEQNYSSHKLKLMVDTGS